MCKCADFLMSNMEQIMSPESEAAKQEIAALKADIERLGTYISDDRTSTADALAAAASDKQALIDLQAEAAAMRERIAALIGPADASST